MLKLQEAEKNNVFNYIDFNEENSCCDFKVKLYDFISKTTDFHDKSDPVKAKYDVIHDCLSFLNNDLYRDKYIIMGVQDPAKTGKCNVVGITGIPSKYSAEVVNHINQYIEPAPQIEIFEMKHGISDADSKDLIVIKIYKENTDYPYILKRSIEKEKKGDNKSICMEGTSFIRTGSSTRPLTRDDLDKFYEKRNKQTSKFLYPYIKTSQMYNNKKFISIFDYIISKDHLVEISKNEIKLLEKIEFVFNCIVGIGSFSYEVSNSTDFFIETLVKLTSDYISVSQQLDNGVNSFILRLFVLINRIYTMEISENCIVEYKSNVITFKIQPTITKTEYEDLTRVYNEITIIMKEVRHINNSVLTSILNLVDIELDDIDESEKQFTDIEAKFHVTNSIIPLLIGPLYGINSYHVGIRELMQNAVDACKSKCFGRLNERLVTINFIVCEESGKNLKVEVCDNGIGMNKDILNNYYFKVGESEKGDKSLGLAGKFGIGVLSGFLLGNIIEVETKHDDDYLYRFKLEKSSFEEKIDDDSHLQISKYDVSRMSGTKITITFEHDDLVNSGDIINFLRINEWCVEDDFKVEILMNNHFKFVLPNINHNGVVWSPIEMADDEFEVFTYIESDLIDQEENEVDEEVGDEVAKYKKILKYIKNNSGKIIYNGISLNCEYEIQNITSNKVPLIRINDRSRRNLTKDKYVDIPLDRKKIDLSSALKDRIANELYLKAFAKLKDYVECENGLIIKKSFQYSYFNTTDLILTKQGYGLKSKEFIKLLKEKGYRKIVTVHTSSKYSVNLDNFKDDYAYIFTSSYFNKTNLADLIEDENIQFLSSKLLNEYFLGLDRIRIKQLCDLINHFILKRYIVSDSLVRKSDRKATLDSIIDANIDHLKYIFSKKELIGIDNTYDDARTVISGEFDGIHALRVCELDEVKCCLFKCTELSSMNEYIYKEDKIESVS